MSIGAYLELVRPVNSAMIGFAVLVGAAIAGGGHLPSPEYSLAGFIAGFSISGAAMALNDYVDIDIDRVNAPRRPLPSGRASPRGALACFALLSLAGVAAASYTGLWTLAVAMAAWLVSVAYNLWGKKTGLPGNAMVAFSVGVPLLYGAALVGEPNPAVSVFWFMVFTSALAREIVKGIADVEGDRRAGVATVAVTRGSRTAARLAATLYIAAVAASPVPVVKGWVNLLAYGLPVAIVDVGLLLEAWRILRDPSPGNALRHKRMVLVYMLIGLFGFLLGASLA